MIEFGFEQQNHERPEGMRRIPQQARSRRVVSSIVNGGLEILEEHGRDGLSTTSLELVSGVPKSTIYEYFPSLDAVVAEVFHTVIRQHHEEGYKRYPLKKPVTVLVFIASIVDWVLSKHRSLLALDRDFYLRYSEFFDFWMEFDKNFNNKDTVANFLTRQLLCCEDFDSSSVDTLLAKVTGHSLSLTTFALLRDDPALIDSPDFRSMLIRMFCAVCKNQNPNERLY